MDNIINEATTISKKVREDIEVYICQVLDLIDKSKQNSDYYKELFAKMSDKEFEDFVKKPYSVVFQIKLFEIEPVMEDVNKAANFMKVPLIERVALPYLYRNKDGNPVWSKPCLVVYLHHKRVQQMISKKNKYSIEVGTRDMSGRLISDNKGAAMSDREFECLAVMGLDYTMREFSKPKADGLESKSYMYNTINTLGDVSESDIEYKKTDSIAKNLMSVYLLGCHINSNLVNEGNYTPYTLSQKNRKVARVN